MICNVCGRNKFEYNEILWEQLTTEWQLSKYEIDYINRQQGLLCISCGSNLRSIALAKALLSSYDFGGSLLEFVRSPLARDIRLLEINPAGTLTEIFDHLPLHRLITYPDYNMMKLDFESDSYDLIVHSDTLEHIEYPITALSECRRVLNDKGRSIFTVPIIVDRFTRSRIGLSKIYHGSPSDSKGDHVVYTEFGIDIWKIVLKAGFSGCSIHCKEFPAGLAVEAFG